MIDVLQRVHRLTESQRRLLRFRLGGTACEGGGEPRLVGYIASRSDEPATAQDLRGFLAGRVPDYMVPSAWVFLSSFPLTSRGKVDRKALSGLARTVPALEPTQVFPQNGIERAIATIWEDLLGVRTVGLYDNFFDLGGHSLLLPNLLGKVQSLSQREVSMIDLFRYPTVHALAAYVRANGDSMHEQVDEHPAGEGSESSVHRARQLRQTGSSGEVQGSGDAQQRLGKRDGGDIAIVGIAGRFPGANNIDAFWNNLCEGIESVSTLSPIELLESGVTPELFGRANYVPARAVLEGIDLFDAEFFNVTPKEAELMDPQQRLFLECAWEALEHAGYNPELYRGSIGVYGGSSTSGYLFNLFSDRVLLQSAADMMAMLGVEKDSLSTRVSYKLNLEGPSLAVQTACSTSLVAVHLACQGLLNGECNMALAGGVSINVPQKVGYLYHEGGIASPDGHCRTFDADAKGTIGGSGVGIVLLKRLAEALNDGDHIWAVIKGSAVNNDGASKVGYTAPRIEGQAKVIRAAQLAAHVAADSITCVEAHGTGTPMGDPIEVAALTQAFRAETARNGFCAIGSVKTNIGHLDAAAGIAGLIKTVLALHHKQIPPSLHFVKPNPHVDFSKTPFYVNSKLIGWEGGGAVRRAGVSSFGLGGTNAHVILEEAPALPREPNHVIPRPQLLLISARSEAALEAATDRLVEHLRRHLTADLAQTAYTLQLGRKAFSYRRWLVADSVEEVERGLARRADCVHTRGPVTCERPVVFLFSGQGAQYPTMGRSLYDDEPVFREHVDRCAELLTTHLGLDIRTLLFAETTAEQALLSQTAMTQPALFVIEHALATLWMAWGIQPVGMMGHSIGEYVAACLAGVFSLEDALAVVAVRGRLMQSMPVGAMTAVSMSERDAQTYLRDALTLAAVNAPRQCVFSGSIQAITTLEENLAKDGLQSRRLNASHAFHSYMMEPILEPFTQCVAGVTRHAPKIPWVSNVTGQWVTPEQAVNPAYWASHLRRTVRFSEGVHTLWQQPERILLEVGPGRTLSTLAQSHAEGRDILTLASLGEAKSGKSETTSMLKTMGHLWGAGVQVDWVRVRAREHRRRIPLPTYPFERRRHWVEPLRPVPAVSLHSVVARKADISEWFYQLSWKRSFLSCGSSQPVDGRWLIFLDEDGVGPVIVENLRRWGRSVVTVTTGEQFQRLAEGVYTVRPAQAEDYDALAADLDLHDEMPSRLVHCWNACTGSDEHTMVDRFQQAQARGLYSLLFLARAFGARGQARPLRILVLSSGLHDVTGNEPLHPERATLLGACRVIPQEYAALTCRMVDLDRDGRQSSRDDRMVDRLMAEIEADDDCSVVALRGSHRWVQTFEPITFREKPEPPIVLRSRGVYLITGGLGGVGLWLAEYLVRTMQARVILTGRSSVAPEHHERLQRLEQIGGEVLTLQADAADVEQMRNVVAMAKERFGVIHGVIHAAGIAGGGLIELKTSEALQAELAPKAIGALTLDHVFQHETMDFVLLCSSLTALTGGVGQAGYCAANTFLDAFAQFQTKRGRRVLSVNFDRWRHVGMAVHLEARFKALKIDDVELDGMTPQEGQEVFHRILHHADLPQIAVSVRDWSALPTQGVDAKVMRLAGLAAQKPSKSGSSGTVSVDPTMKLSGTLEEQVATLWMQLIGIERVGPQDDFFSLGGESLLALQILNRVQEVYRVDISLRQFFNAPTVAGLAEHIRTARIDERPQAPDITPLPREARRLYGVALQAGTVSKGKGG